MGYVFLAFMHSFFITALVVSVGLEMKVFTNIVKVIQAAIILTVSIWLFGYLDNRGASYFCADGIAHVQSSIPLLPWLWIGWLCVTLFALPARITILVFREDRKLKSIWLRVFMVLPFMVILYALGYFFQIRQIDCTLPQISFGLFEGGITLIPLYLVFISTLTFSIAIVSAFSINRK